MRKSRPDFKAAAALKLAMDRQFAVFPVSGKFPFAGTRGFKDASRDSAVIARRWKQHPFANIAIATGQVSNLVVVDCDFDSETGVDGLLSLDKKFGDRFQVDSDKQLIAHTPNQGVHLYYRADGKSIRSRQGVLPAVDIRADGGFVVAPPSALKIDGKWVAYRFVNPNAEIPPMPDWVGELASKPCEFAQAWKQMSTNPHIDATLDTALVGFPKGQRDEGLFRYACRMRAFDVAIEQAMQQITTAASMCQPPFDPELARNKVAYAYSRYPAGRRPKADSLSSSIEKLTAKMKGGFSNGL
jgi:hypothetical protein